MNKKEKFDFYDQTYLKSYNLEESIKYQLNLLDSLDIFTRKHCENVATLTSNLCKKLHCSKGFTEYCIICAYLHDIGKLFIPASILQKPSQLTPDEFEIMKTHTTLGYQLCIKDKKLRPYHAGPYYHHEALDGTGYPQGLVKSQIPYEAQIIRVADEFDAIVSKRQYKSHIGISETLKIIIDNAKPSPDAPKGTGFTDNGKNNKKVVKKLIKVVLDDIDYEISCTMDYIDYLSAEINRYKKIEGYIQKKKSAKKETDIAYYQEYINMLLKKDETEEKFDNLYQEIKEARSLKEKSLDELKNEIKTIKKLKV